MSFMCKFRAFLQYCFMVLNIATYLCTYINHYILLILNVILDLILSEFLVQFFGVVMASLQEYIIYFSKFILLNS